jgi:hypothetical protein
MDAFAQLAAVALILFTLGFFWWLVRNNGRINLGWFRITGRNSSAIPEASQVQVLSRSHLTPQHHIHLVKAFEQFLIVSTHPGGCSVLLSIPASQSGTSIPSTGAPQ